MNKKGFTVVELIVSFSLVTIISIILFQLIFSLKELYVSGDIKTALLNKQGIMVKKIYDDLNEDTLTEITSCGVSCLTFKYGEIEKELLVDVAANTLKYDDYTMKLSDGSYFDNINFEYGIIDNTTTTKDNSKFDISIPIRSKFLPDDDFGIHIVKTYTNNSIFIDNNINVGVATIVANGIPLNIRADNSLTGTTTYWANIFHQDQKNIDLNNEDAYFKDYNEFVKVNNPHKKSSLKSLETFKIPCEYVDNPNTSDEKEVQCNIQFNDVENHLQTIDLVTEATRDKTEKEIKKIKENYQNGYFELLLEYPSISQSNNNIWTQTSNFATNSKLENVYTIDTVYQGEGCLWNGLKSLKNSEQSFVNGCQGTDRFAIGTKKSNEQIPGPGGDSNWNTVDEVNLWIKVDDYIDKYALSIIN